MIHYEISETWHRLRCALFLYESSVLACNPDTAPQARRMLTHLDMVISYCCRACSLFVLIIIIINYLELIIYYLRLIMGFGYCCRASMAWILLCTSIWPSSRVTGSSLQDRSFIGSDACIHH